MTPRTKTCIREAISDNSLMSLFILLMAYCFYRWLPDDPYVGGACFLLMLFQVMSHVQSYWFFQYIYDVTSFTVNGRYFEIGHREAFVRRWEADHVPLTGSEMYKDVMVFNYDIVIVPAKLGDLLHVEKLTKARWKYGNKLTIYNHVKMMFDGALSYAMREGNGEHT
jgi:hypothetical protein